MSDVKDVSEDTEEVEKKGNFEVARGQMKKRQEKRKSKEVAKAILDGKIATSPEEVEEMDNDEAYAEIEEKPVMASFSSVFAEKRSCLVPILNTEGDTEYIKVYSISTKDRDSMTEDCQTKKWNKQLRRTEVTDFDGEKFATLMLLSCLDDEFVANIPGKTEDEKIKILKEKIPSYDLQFILDVIQQISGLDMDNVELIKKEFGLVACQTKPILTQLLNL